MGTLILGRRAVSQVILSTMTSATAVPACALIRAPLVGLAGAGGAATITLAANTAAGTALEGFFDGCNVEITGGTGAGQLRKISAYVGSTRVATVSQAWATAPDNTSLYKVSHDCDGLQAQAILIDVETAGVNVCINGATPTVTAGTNIGTSLDVGTSWMLEGVDNVNNFKCINAVNASGAVVKIITFV